MKGLVWHVSMLHGIVGSFFEMDSTMKTTALAFHYSDIFAKHFAIKIKTNERYKCNCFSVFQRTRFSRT